MDNTEHPYSALTPDTVLDAIEAKGFLCDGRIFPLNSYENRVYQIGIEDEQPLIAKFYRPNRWSEAQIREEQAFSFELAEQEWPVVTPTKDANGESLHSFGDFHFALFERKGGHAPELDNLENLKVLGRCMGRLHAVGIEKPFEHRPGIDVQSYAIDSYRFLLDQQFIPAELETAYRTLAEDLIERLQQSFSEVKYEPIRLHGDCHPGNILWRDLGDTDNAPHFVDFDDCRMGPAVQDIWMLLSGERHQQQAQLEAILSGYRQFCFFDARELRLIEPLRTLRLMNYAAWLARRWNDPAFPQNFPWFNTERYWSEHILTLREQLAALQEPPLEILN